MIGTLFIIQVPPHTCDLVEKRKLAIPSLRIVQNYVGQLLPNESGCKNHHLHIIQPVTTHNTAQWLLKYSRVHRYLGCSAFILPLHLNVYHNIHEKKLLSSLSMFVWPFLKKNLYMNLLGFRKICICLFMTQYLLAY